MKRLLILLITLAPLSAWSLQTISGSLTRFGGGLSIRLANEPTQLYRLVGNTPDIQRMLGRMDTDDAIVGAADVDAERRVVQLQSLDFVGLRKILGFWNSTNNRGMINFKNYSDMNVYSILQSARQAKQFKYTVAPGQGNEWAFFLTDQSQTQVGLLNLGEHFATLKLFDSSTGEVLQVIKLQKM